MNQHSSMKYMDGVHEEGRESGLHEKRDDDFRA
jgi:hypothetical protein